MCLQFTADRTRYNTLTGSTSYLAVMGRRCIFGCANYRNLFPFPPNPWLRRQWLEFTHFEEGGLCMNSRLCDRHFSEDCFLNLGMYTAGMASYLTLSENAVPSLYTVGASPSVKDTTGSTCGMLPAVKHVASQTDPPKGPCVSTQTQGGKSVGTQLSMKTLQNHFRSKATQARVSSRDCGVCTLTFPLDSPLLFLQPTIVKRPSKRPRLSLTDEEEGPSQCSLSVVVHEPEDST